MDPLSIFLDHDGQTTHFNFTSFLTLFHFLSSHALEQSSSQKKEKKSIDNSITDAKGIGEQRTGKRTTKRGEREKK